MNEIQYQRLNSGKPHYLSKPSQQDVARKSTLQDQFDRRPPLLVKFGFDHFLPVSDRLPPSGVQHDRSGLRRRRHSLGSLVAGRDRRQHLPLEISHFPNLAVDKRLPLLGPDRCRPVNSASQHFKHGPGIESVRFHHKAHSQSVGTPLCRCALPLHLVSRGPNRNLRLFGLQKRAADPEGDSRQEVEVLLQRQTAASTVTSSAVFVNDKFSAILTDHYF